MSDEGNIAKTKISGQSADSVSSWLYVAFAATGFLIGFAAGLSSSPVVKALLPLLFGLIAGGAGFFASNRIHYSRAIGISLTCLTVMVSVGLVQGIVVRNDSSWKSFFTHENPEVIPMGQLDATTLKKYTVLIALRWQMQDIGLSAKEQARILAAAAQTDDATVKEITTYLSDATVKKPRTDFVHSLANRYILFDSQGDPTHQTGGGN